MVTLSINGEQRQLDVDPDMPLLWALRDVAKLTGTKYGCGKGLCGACTVHLNGQPIRACLTPIKVVGDGKVTTIEGLSENGDHPVQKAWLAHNVPQCGYCQSGQIMSAVALLETNKNPSDEQINTAMSGNICRCGTYGRIRQAIHSAADLAREVK
ncbi:MAG: (2Fe-2S)-binding protein [Psychrosphaera sp.]|nr:(2Fe-2S)-binding protein [Psychrosphaera sp.]